MNRMSISRGQPLRRSSKRLARGKRLSPIGRRGREARIALKSVRAVVLERAGWRCERCKGHVFVVGRLHLHHKRKRSQGGTHDSANVRALCARCHRSIHEHRAKDWRVWIETRRGA